ncbi:fatty acid desaturase family protein [Sansalvadorimonas verongulae]|uniref:fatty acid desaturase family protein n=1 Tax=Sansalvadorimonas verongulae TaxID=2172824 RepID=UPI0012BB5C70|nr:fatty acid desaturase family protein [Sansalvadorimonas verongulae]MTI14753.1 fatty acid desaturase [Sansalvadorimonas verongulae]
MNNNSDPQTLNSQTLFEQGLQRKNARKQLSELLGDDVIKQLQIRSNLMGWRAVLSCWVVIFGAMTAIAVVQNQPLWISIPVIVCALAIIGGRQLGLAILVHEASHRSLFKSARLNDSATQWLCGYPILLHLGKYRKHHAQHHTKTGSQEDIDYSLIRHLPTTRRSLARKFTRDLLGITGLKNTYGLLLMHAGVLRWTVSADVERLPVEGRRGIDIARQFASEVWPTVLCNLALFLLATAVGHPELYLAWIVAYLIPYPLFMRIRSMAEHAMTEQVPDMLRNTRSTRAGWVARALVAPYHVNYHIEHHALVSVPYWHLPKLHRLLQDKKLVPEPPGYWDVLKRVSSRVA